MKRARAIAGTMQTLRRVAGRAVLMLAMAPGIAAAQAEPEDFPDPGATLVDPDFRVETREFGLDRRVEMFQWRMGESGYERVWHGAPIDSSGFDATHRNPPRLSIENRRWWAERPTLDGNPLDPAVLRSLGQWQVLHPGFSRLPANLAASFQPEGEGLGSAENPLEPEIGDLRVTWRKLVLPPLAGKVLLRDGVWVLAEDVVGDQRPPPATVASDESQHAQRMWPFFAGGLIVIVAIVVAVQRHRHRRNK